MNQAAQELLAAAARCYVRAEHTDDACRCLEWLGRWAEAAALHAGAGRLPEAARSYERARRFLDAARCYREAGSLHDVARCLIAGDDPIRAAWLLAHELLRFSEARVALAKGRLASPEEAVAAELVEARCDLAQRDRPGAARKLRRALPALAAIPPHAAWRCAVEWALALCRELGRPDLAVLLLAGGSDPAAAAEAAWDRFSNEALGGAFPAPVSLSQRFAADSAAAPATTGGEQRDE